MTKAGAATTIPVLLLGCGGVGRHLLHHIVATRDLHSRRGLVLRVLGVCDSRSLLLVDDVFAKGFDDAFLTEICRMKSSSSSLSALVGLGHCHLFTDVEATTKILEVAGLLGRSSGLAVVDCSASSETVGLLKQVTIPGCCLILANKKPLTCAIEDYDKLTSDFRRIRFESTVGAGLPIIVSVTRVITSGDPICRIIGSLSGTLGYVMSEVDDRRLLSEVVLAAKSLGYTEPGLPSTRMEEVLPACKSLSCANSASYVSVKSLFIRNLHKLQPDCGFMLCALGCDVAHENPRDDLSGMDVARKALILARLLGWRINMDDIQVESLYPNELGPNSMSTEDFFKTGLPSLDRNIKERVSAASSRGKVLRYVCIIEDSRCQVGLQELPKDSALGRLRGSDNVVEIYSRCYSKSPLVIQGAGAGNDTTAAGVLADIIDLQDLFHQV